MDWTTYWAIIGQVVIASFVLAIPISFAVIVIRSAWKR